MSQVILENITKTFKDHVALDNISFSIEDGEFFVLLGPTGAGKTTTMRVIAGLERQNSGRVMIDGADMASVTPADRDVAFVFQQYSLYPGMSVYDNLAFPLRSPLRRVPEKEIKERVTTTAEKLRVAHLLTRKTAKLSGGEMQRVSIGRALVRNPRIYLMDEPLSNLDAKLREALRIELKHIQKTQHSTTLFVTHDQIEALTMADRIAVLNEGRILQIGTPTDIYDQPATTVVAQLVGIPRINLLHTLKEGDVLKVQDSTLQLQGFTQALPPTFLLGIRPEDIHIHANGQHQGRVALLEPLGVETVVHIRCGEQILLSVVSGIAPYGVDTDVRFDITKERVHFFDVSGIRL
jgi:multiple sugar transport system ATP-binding protein